MNFDIRLKNTSMYLQIHVHVCVCVFVRAWQPGNGGSSSSGSNIKNVAHLNAASTSLLLRKIPLLWPTHIQTRTVHNVYPKDTKSAFNLNVLRSARARYRERESE